MSIHDLHEANRAGWNEGSAAYEADLEAQIEFLRRGGTNFEPPEFDYLQNLGAWCNRAIHLQCAGGTDTLSLYNMGANEVVGIDISDGMIEVARRKSAALHARATWYRCDVLDAPHELDGTADLVYTGRGALCWIQDLLAWSRVVARLLKPGGKLYVFEGHPIMNIWDYSKSEWVLDEKFGDYFSNEVLSEAGWPETYIGDLDKPPGEHAVKHERQWRFGDVINPLVETGLRLLRLEEHPDPYWNSMPKMDPAKLRKLPQTYSLYMEKPV